MDKIHSGNSRRRSKMKRFEKLILAIVIILCIGGLYSLLINQSTPVHGSGPSDSGRMVTALGSVSYSGYQTLTPNSTTASSITPTSTSQEYARITTETANVRYRLDGTSPTTSEGHLLAYPASINLVTRGQIDNFKVISVGTHGVLKISYGR
jgi:hypothetical protein